jgi:voltage-gated potassium channel
MTRWRALCRVAAGCAERGSHLEREPRCDAPIAAGLAPGAGIAIFMGVVAALRPCAWASSLSRGPIASPMPILTRHSHDTELARHHSVRRQFLAAVGIIVITLAGAAAGMVLLSEERGDLPESIGQGLWNAVNALSTAGDFSDLGRGQKVWMGAVLVVGGASMVYATGTLTSLVVSGAPWRARQQRRLERQMQSLSGHAIVCGYGETGRAVVDRLVARGLAVVVVDRDPDAARQASDAGHLVVQGDAGEQQTLLDAGIANAAVVAALLGGHVEKLAVTMMARNLAPEAIMISTAASSTGRDWLKVAGASVVVMASEVVAGEFDREVAERLVRSGRS